MEMIWNDERIRKEIKRLDGITGLSGAMLPIAFNNAKCVLGSFCFGKNLKFCFSNYWFQNPDWPTECAIDVIRHEYAHYMDHEIYGNSGHGKTWKKCCCDIGAVPLRLYNKEIEKYYREKLRKENMIICRYDNYKVGRILMHPKYERGEIIAIEGEDPRKYLIIDFTKTVGIKKLDIKWVAENCEVKNN